MAGSASAPDPAPSREGAQNACAAPRPGTALLRLTKRRDFLAAARARKWTSKGFILQARQRGAEERFVAPDAARVGFTASKKVGGAVVRNRAKRRLRALAAAHLPNHARPGWDYVLIARAEETAARPFATLEGELIEAMGKIHAARGGGAKDGARKGGGRKSGGRRRQTADAPTPRETSPS